MKEVEEIIDEFDTYGINTHMLPNAIGMWPNEQECFVWSALTSEKGDFLEIGSFCGGSAVLMGLVIRNTKRSDKVYSVDIDFNIHNMYDMNIKRAGLGNICQPIQYDSSKIGSVYKGNPVSFLFIDGWHSFKQVMIDFEQMKPFLTENATVMFHDVSPYIYDKSYLSQLENYNNYSDEEDFRLDEALAVILKENKDFKLIKNPMQKSVKHFDETGLTQWVRGKTSPFNSICTIRRNV